MARLIALALSLACLVGPGHAGGEPSLLLSASTDRPAEIGGLWKYSPGDDPTWAAPDFDDGGWILASPLIKNGGHDLEGWQGVGWFRRWVHLDSGLAAEGLALVHMQFGASEIYVDGRLVQRYGRIAAAAEEEYTDIDRMPRFAGRPNDWHAAPRLSAPLL